VRLVEVDLDDVAGLERLWAELARHRAIRDADPPLRAAILRRCDRLSADVAAPVLHALDEMHPEVVLESFFTTIVPNMPTIGAFQPAHRNSMDASMEYNEMSREEADRNAKARQGTRTDLKPNITQRVGESSGEANEEIAQKLGISGEQVAP